MITKIFMVGVGGFFGCISRFLICYIAAKINYTPTLPWGTMLANISGCFIIGLIGCYFQIKHPTSPLLAPLLITGFLGGLTTFSSYSLESFTLFQEGYFFHGLFNVTSQVILGMIAIAAGFKLINHFFS